MMAAPIVADTTKARAPAERELDPATLARCQAGDPIAFRAFVVRYQRLVFALLSRMLGHGPHVEDLAQETFLRALRAMPRFAVDGPALPSTWLLTIASRLALDAIKRKRLPVTPLDQAKRVVASGDPEQQAQRADLREAVSRATASLSDDQRLVLILSDLHGLSQAEVGEIVGAPEATVKTRLFRARARLRQLLTPIREDI